MSDRRRIVLLNGQVPRYDPLADSVLVDEFLAWMSDKIWPQFHQVLEQRQTLTVQHESRIMLCVDVGDLDLASLAIMGTNIDDICVEIQGKWFNTVRAQTRQSYKRSFRG